MGKIIRNDKVYSGAYSNATDVNYDNSVSKLNAGTSQEALDELANGLKNTSPVDNLLSTSTTLPLSANQGRILNESLEPQFVAIKDSDLFDTARYEEANGGYFKIGKLVIVELRVKVKSDISSNGLTNVVKSGVFPTHSKPNGSLSLSCYTTTGLSLGTYLSVDGTIGFYGQSDKTITAGSFIVIGGVYIGN